MSFCMRSILTLHEIVCAGGELGSQDIAIVIKSVEVNQFQAVSLKLRLTRAV